MSEYEWPDSFWPDFIDQYWEQHPTSFVCPAIKPFISLTELFEAVTNMPSKDPSDRFWIARKNPPKKIGDFTMAALKLMGPQKSDGDFNGYFKRLNQHTAGINIHALEKGKPGLWQRIPGFEKNLSHAKNSPPSDCWVLDTFFGTYRATPFGIHEDLASVFAFVLMGERTYCTWEHDYFKKGDEALGTPDLDKIEPHLKNSQTFTVKPGEVFYWPSNRWHVAMSNGKPSVVVQVSTYFNKKGLKHLKTKPTATKNTHL